MQKQLDDLWTLVKQKEKEVRQIEDRITLVKNHSKITQLIENFEPLLQEATGKTRRTSLFYLPVSISMDDLDMASSVTSITEELATALDLKRHQMSFADVNPISKEELEKITTVMKGGSHLCDKIKPEILEEAASTSGSVFRLDEDTTKMTQVMAEYVTIYETIYCLVK